MNFLIDNNLPPAIARALHQLCEGEGHAVVALRDKFDQCASDIHWISSLKAEGQWSVVSQDKFTKGDMERKAFRECGLPIFCLAKQWGQEPFWSKASNLVRWWPAIIRQSELVGAGGAFRVRWKFTAPAQFDAINL